MNKKILQVIRLVIAGGVFVLCGLAFYNQFYPVKVFDVQVIAVIQSVLLGSTAAIVISVILFLITLLLGRVYCSTLCPLGIYQELLMFLFRPFYKKRKKTEVQGHWSGAYVIAAILFGTFWGGTAVLMRMFEPYSVAGNALSGAWYGVGFIVALAVLVFFKKRFFCTHLCPVGTVLGLISRYSLFKIRIDANKCKLCSLCAKVCPVGCIDFEKHDVHNEMCIKCFKCLGNCSYGALRYGLAQKEKIAFSAKRRDLVKSGLLLVMFGTALRCGMDLSQKIGAKFKRVLLPAGAGKAEDFANRCLNCNLCVKNCPMKIIQPATAEVPFVHLDYSHGYCRYGCHKCSEVCPSGAIKKISLAEKQKTKLATAKIDENICIKCGACVHECPVKAIEKERGGYPFVHFDKCIGCGKCGYSCPVKAIAMEAVDKQVFVN